MENGTDRKQLNRKIFETAQQIARTYEQDGYEEAFKLWEGFHQSMMAHESKLSSESLDVMIELKILMQEPERADMSELQHAIYRAKAAITK